MKAPSAAYITAEEQKTRQPAELFHIWTEAGAHWRYTNGDLAVVYGGNTFVPATLQRDEIQYSGQLEVTTLNISIAALASPVVQYMASTPLDIVWIEVLRMNRDVAAEVLPVFIGHIKRVSFKGAAAQVECVGLEFFLRQPIPRYRYQAGCNWTVFSEFCGLTKATYTHAVTLATVSADGLTLTSADFDALADGYFLYGELVYGDQRRMLVYHVGATVMMQYKIADLADGASVSAVAGCDWSHARCTALGNTDNYGGFRSVPVKNPTVQL